MDEPTPASANVSFQIRPGAKTRIRKITFVGNKVFCSRVLVDQLKLTRAWRWYWPLSAKSLYHPAKWDQDVGGIRDLYQNNGYLDAVVAFQAKIRFLEALIAHARRLSGEGQPVVFCGDLNVAHREIDVHPKERKDTVIGQLPEERALFDRLLAEDMVDVGRALDPDNDQLFTWWPPWRAMRQRNIGWRIDYVLASAPLAAKAVACAAYPDIGTSDHGPVVATLQV